VYLGVIGVADVYYAGAYILYDDWWRNSFLCKSMSFLAMFSSELTIAILVCITIERYVTICNVSRMKLHLSKKLPVVMVPLAWCTTLIVSLLPLSFTWLYEESYAATNSICIHLDMSASSAFKAVYLMCVYVIYNGVGFLMILLMYVHIVRTHVQSSKRVGRDVNLTLFKRSVLIVLTNFLCWAPVAGFVLFSYINSSSSSGAAVWMAILVLPINSAANPVLYTLSAMCKPCAKRRSRKKK
jgi:hypothetical protein